MGGGETGGGGVVPLHGGAPVIARHRGHPRWHVVVAETGQIVEGFNVTEIGGCRERTSEHPDFLTLIDERRPALQEVSRREGRSRLSPICLSIAESGDRTRLIVVLQIQSVPAAFPERLLPTSEDIGELALRKGAR